MRRDDWIDEDEYPDEDDIEAFGEESPPDDHPLTIGYVGSSRPRFWTKGRIALVVVVAGIRANKPISKRNLSSRTNFEPYPSPTFVEQRIHVAARPQTPAHDQPDDVVA